MSNRKLPKNVDELPIIGLYNHKSYYIYHDKEFKKVFDEALKYRHVIYIFDGQSFLIYRLNKSQFLYVDIHKSD